ncbi:MAG: hypothetical protein E5W90_20015 [Mesorhizobium sp.]|nr:MAG: hypothetical protein E5W90_20015 [Mesorhizobium sp.]
MKLVKFELQNFKGVSKTSINLSDEVPGNVVTLIGLNESGKTTILEGISHFVTEDKETASLVGTVHQKSVLQDIIPKDKKAAFTGTISIEATLELDDNDKKFLADFFLDKHSLYLDMSEMSSSFTLERAYIFEDSSRKETKTYWGINFPLKEKKGKKYKVYGSKDETRLMWLEGIEQIRSKIPRLVFFPTFLFNFPDRIYLEEDKDTDINKYYKQVIQDVLDSQGEGLSIQRHVVERVKRRRDAFTTPALFISYLLGLDEKSQIDALMQKISSEMSRVIFGAWSDILGKRVSGKRVQVDWFIDNEKGNMPYIQVSIIDGQSRYALSERSLGFRWFFSFLLFTQFRRNRRDDVDTIFLFDEPASNLHSKAQMKLLESFSKIAKGGTYIVYSTHSHYMVNPLWLEKSYIVENKAVDYDDEDEGFAIKKTDVVATRYRSFVAKNPSKTTYFQPVLDALDVNFSPLFMSSEAIIVEGKFDYHPFFYFRRILAGSDSPKIYPASGAGDMGNLINLFRGWGVNFRIVLDDDKAGREAKKRYEKDYLVPESHIATIGSISADLKDKAFEAIYQEDVRDATNNYFETSNATKRQFALFFQQQLAEKSVRRFPMTEAVFEPISKWVDEAFK